MHRYIILAQSDANAKALEVWIDLLGEAHDAEAGKTCIVWDQSIINKSPMDAFAILVERIREAATLIDGRLPLNETTVLIDFVRPKGLNAIDESGNWDSLIAKLILAFPEIRWVFGVMGSGSRDEDWLTNIKPNHELASLLGPTVREPLFDPDGLRQWVRKQTNQGLDDKTESDDLKLPIRSKDATVAAVDEERPYAYLHAYTSFRFGCRADVVTTWSGMENRFGKRGTVPQAGHGYWLLFEDMSLKFPDKPGRTRLFDLQRDRAENCPLLDSTRPDLENSAHRILVTTGQSRHGDNRLQLNRRYLKQCKAPGRGDVLFKPLCGMFDLWTKAGLYRTRAETRRRGDAPGFVWPPPHPSQGTGDADRGPSAASSGHGTPGMLLLVSESLIARARAMYTTELTVSDAIHGATLATEALEMTGGRTPTTAIEALSLKHRFEILAECQFSGVENHISITPRLAEIDQETRAICRWFAPHQRTDATLNGRMHILNQLISTLRACNQFDEEQVCMNRVRGIHATLWMRAKPWRYIFWPPIRYVQLLLSSLPNFALVLTFWVLFLGLMFAWVEPCAPQWGMERLTGGLESAVTSFFSVGAPIQQGKAFNNLTHLQVSVRALAIISGFLHLGILISHLYLIVSRR